LYPNAWERAADGIFDSYHRPSGDGHEHPDDDNLP